MLRILRKKKLGNVILNLYTFNLIISRSFSAIFPDERRERKLSLSPEKESAHRGSIDFIQSAVPLIPISNRLLGSRRTIGLITDRDKTRTSSISRRYMCVNIYTCVEAHFFPLFPFLLLISILFFRDHEPYYYSSRNKVCKYTIFRENRNKINVKEPYRECIYIYI